jgi:hypothetical protein
MAREAARLSCSCAAASASLTARSTHPTSSPAVLPPPPLTSPGCGAERARAPAYAPACPYARLARMRAPTRGTGAASRYRLAGLPASSAGPFEALCRPHPALERATEMASVASRGHQNGPGSLRGAEPAGLCRRLDGRAAARESRGWRAQWHSTISRNLAVSPW